MWRVCGQFEAIAAGLPFRDARRAAGWGTDEAATVSAVASTVWPYPVSEAPPTRPYREALSLLRLHEGRRCLWRVVAGGAVLLLLAGASVAGIAAGGYLAGKLDRPLLVVLGAVIVLAVPALDSYFWRRQPWRRLVTDRLATYERNDGGVDLNATVRLADFLSASAALRRAKLYPEGGTRMPQGPPDAPELVMKLRVGRSAHWHGAGSPELIDQIGDALRVAGIRARVGGVDINAD
jgi:hypothetical protein